MTHMPCCKQCHGKRPLRLAAILEMLLLHTELGRRPLPTSSGRHAWAAATAAAGAKATAVTLVAVAAVALAVTVPVAAPAPIRKVRPIPNCVVALLVWKLVNQCPYRMYVSIACIGRNDVHMHMVEMCI